MSSNNLKGKYTSSELKALLNLQYRMQIIRLHDLLPFEIVGNVHAYDAEKANEYALQNGIPAKKVQEFNAMAQARDIPLDRYVTLLECQRLTRFTRAHIHANREKFRRVKFGRLTLYSLDDIAKWKPVGGD